MINSDYEMDVNRALVKEGKEADFVASERTWGEHVTPSLIVNNDEYSIQLRVLNTSSDTVYRINGEMIDKSVIEPFMPAKKEYENPVVIRSYKVDRIKALRMGGEEFIIL